MALASHQVLEQLEQALGTGHVPTEEKQRAALLLSRLRSPVQVVLIGRPGSGKSRLINMLTESSVIPDIADLPPLEITYGPRPRTVYLMVDGSEQAIDGLHMDRPVPADAAILRAELPLETLNRFSLTELSLSGTPAEQKAIVDWATQRADIVLWCSQSFDASEQALWSSTRDALKDHSFLVLTKADQLQMKGVLSARITDLEEVVAEEFYRMYPVATIQAISSMGTDGARDDNTWTSSGGKALADAVQRLVETGRSADTDNALMFLKRYAPDMPDTPRQSPQENAGVRPDPEPYPWSEASGQSAPGPQSAPQPTAKPAAENNPADAFKTALEFLQKRADSMLSAVSENGPEGGAGKQSFVLDHCLETASKLSEIMMDAEQFDPALTGIQEDVMECSDMMILFHLEKTEDAATDAVTLLLQLKKEMSVAVTT